MENKSSSFKNRFSVKKLIILIAAAAVCAFLLELVQINTAPKYYHCVPSEELRANEEVIYPDRYAGAINYEERENGFAVTDGDPQLYFDTTGCKEYSYVYLYYREPTTSEEAVQVFYPAVDYIREEDSQRTTVPAGTTFWSCQIPPAAYHMVRIDIDTDFVPIEKISVGSIEPEYVTEPNPIHPLRIAVVAFALIMALIWMWWMNVWGMLVKTVRSAFAYIRENRKKSLLNVLLFIAIAGITAVFFWFLFYKLPEIRNGGPKIAGPQIVFAILLGCFAASMLVFRKTLAHQPEYIFLVLMLCLGFLFSYYMPHNGTQTWDEEVHYGQALRASYVDELRMTEQDRFTSWAREPAQYEINEGLKAHQDKQDDRNRVSVYTASAHLGIQYVSEVFNGIGLFTGRALGLRYYQIHFMGRFFGFLAYAIIGFLAIRKLKSGKMLAAVIMLIPEAMFLATNYNYDSYLTAFTLLGLSYYIAQWQNRSEKMSLKDAVIMIGAIAFGCISKPVYLPLLLIVMVLPKEKFSSSKQRLWLWLGMIGAFVLVVLSYALPIVLRGSGISDTRGGGDVSGGNQISFIMSNPFKYLEILWRFLVDDYLNPERANFRYTFFAYDGLFPNQYVVMALLLVVAFTDKNEYDQPFSENIWRRIWPLLVTAGTMILVVTSMYIAFTPVGYKTINGAQYRYLIPLYFPFLYYLGSGLVQNRMNRAWYNGVVLSVAAYACFADVFNAYVVHYF